MEELIFRFVCSFSCKMWIVNVMFAEITNSLLSSVWRHLFTHMGTDNAKYGFISRKSSRNFLYKKFSHIYNNPGKANIWGGVFTVHRSNLSCVLFCLRLILINCTRKIFF
jgi:hypothetical protein